MQDNYVGDIGDLAKLGLLRALSTSDRQLGVAWYLYPHEEGPDGQHIEYVDQPEIWRPVDRELFDGLRGIITRWRNYQGERRVMDGAYLSLLPCTVFADEALCYHPRTNNDPNREDWRHGWFERVIERLENCDIVFADPDNGLYDNDRFQYDGRDGHWKRLPLGEALALSGNRTAIIYHHNTRSEGGLHAEIRHWMRLLPGCTHAFRCRRNTNRTFFVLNADNNTIARLAAFVERWREAEGRAGIQDTLLSELVVQV